MCGTMRQSVPYDVVNLLCMVLVQPHPLTSVSLRSISVRPIAGSQVQPTGTDERRQATEYHTILSRAYLIATVTTR